MEIVELLKRRVREPKPGTVPEPAGSFRLTEIIVKSGRLWVGDPQMSYAEGREESGCIVRLPAGRYRVTVQCVQFDKAIFTSRMCVCLLGVRRPIIGKKLGEAGTDSAQIGVCDVREMTAAYREAFGEDEDRLFRYFDKQLNGYGGILQPTGRGGAKLPFVMSGLGDGMGPVHELRSGGKRVGIDAEFIPADFVYGI